ncbi:NUDIX domain-containing protein [uncultured Caulobacter sp.]|uniref:NUDIX hydrolase n=1 Tax=uncultured Caulobacter sp. TaxID=158749 RepID=UPI00261F53D5|nr:NUDIX domain-containing protein [uncultured Caulobacter sp.]
MAYTVGVFATVFDDAGRVLLVRQAYGEQAWTQPGGGLEVGETPIEGVLREILEETGCVAEVTAFIGTYVSVFRSDVVLHFEARVVEHGQREPDDEIADLGFFIADDLPGHMRVHTRARVGDGLARRRNILRTLTSVDVWSDF